jgi:exonuclease SbcD
MGEVNGLLSDRLWVALEGEIRRLDPDLPTVLLAHAMIDTASYGAERFLAVGKGFTLPMSLLSRPCFDYVALGHVHRHQVLNQSPPVVYPGSIERVDFSEEKEDKGYVMVNLSQEKTTFEFCSLPVRPFRTIEVDLAKAKDPQSKLLKALSRDRIQDAVVRLIYQVRSDQIDQIDQTELHQILSLAHSYTIRPEVVSQLARPRLPELGLGNQLDPLEALETYLANREDLREMQADILTVARSLLAEDETLRLETLTPVAEPACSTAQIEDQTANQQLRLL